MVILKFPIGWQSNHFLNDCSAIDRIFQIAKKHKIKWLFKKCIALLSIIIVFIATQNLSSMTTIGTSCVRERPMKW